MRLIPNALGDLLTPSAVSVSRDGMIHIGATARDRMATSPENTATSFKWLMGTSRATSLAGNVLFPGKKIVGAHPALASR